MPDDCVFCQIVAGESPADVVHETEQTLAFLDIQPWTRGHTLVIPRAHHDDWWDVPRDLAMAVAGAAHDVGALVRDNLGADGINLFQATRPVAWQTVFHLHVHVLPRREGDDLRQPAEWLRSGVDGDRPATAAALRGGPTA